MEHTTIMGSHELPGTWIMDHHSYKESIWLCKQSNDAWCIYYSLHSLVYMEYDDGVILAVDWQKCCRRVPMQGYCGIVHLLLSLHSSFVQKRLMQLRGSGSSQSSNVTICIVNKHKLYFVSPPGPSAFLLVPAYHI